MEVGVLSKGAVGYREALEMTDVERYGVLVALRELNGWVYLGHGQWQEPEHITAMKRQQREMQSRGDASVRQPKILRAVRIRPRSAG